MTSYKKIAGRLGSGTYDIIYRNRNKTMGTARMQVARGSQINDYVKKNRGKLIIAIRK